MVTGQQYVQPGQLAAAPSVLPAQFDIGTLLASITPLIMLMFVFMMIMPMMRGLSEAFKGSAKS
jgi:hypothetical protein